MRRVHSLLVGLLVFSLATDAVRACGHLRHWHHCPSPGPVTVVIVDADDWDCCCPVEPACAADCGWCDVTVAMPVGDVAACCEEIAHAASLDALDASAVVAAAPFVSDESAGLSSVVVSAAAPTLAPAPQPARSGPAANAPEPIAAVPALEPVEPEVAAATDAVIEPPAPRNAFEEADAELVPDVDTPAPAVEPAPRAEPAADPAAESRRVREPLRRWIDDTAAYAVVGRLVDVRGEHVEILRADGRSVTVPLARLSGLDRGYVTGAAARIAAARPLGPQPTDTVGR